MESNEAREAVLDGDLHVEGSGCCATSRECRRCGGRTHYQAMYGSFAELCERCPQDVPFWEPSGTFEEIGDAGWSIVVRKVPR